jgi:hypothetical protein
MPSTQEYLGSFTRTGDRRQHPRKITALAYVRLGDSNGGIILNISEGGLAVAAAEILVGEELPCLRFQLGVDANWIETSGQIVWLTDSKKGAGIQFINLTDEDRNQITRWISSRESFAFTQDSEGSLRESEKQTRTPPPAPRNPVSEPGIVDARAETRLERLFPSENAPRLDAVKPAEIPVNPLVQPPAQIPIQPRVTQSNELMVEKLPDFGYQMRNDWVEPETTEHLSMLHLVFFAILLTVTSFVVGMAVGRGSIDQWLANIDRSTAEEKDQSPSATAHPVDAVPKPSSPPKADAPGPAADSSTQELPPPASPNSHASRGGEKQTAPAETRPVAPTVTREADKEPPLLDQRREQNPEQNREQRLVTPPGEGNPPFLLTMPAKAVSASSSLAISYQSLIWVTAEPGTGSSHHPERLLVGGLISHVEPQDSRVQAQSQTEEIVRLRAAVGEDGEVTDVKPISGPTPLVPVSMRAIREWRYAPTLLDGHPVKTEADILIAFRAR